MPQELKNIISEILSDMCLLVKGDLQFQLLNYDSFRVQLVLCYEKGTFSGKSVIFYVIFFILLVMS